MPKKKKAKKQTVTIKILSLITREPELFINELSDLCSRFCNKDDNDYHFKYDINE